MVQPDRLKSCVRSRPFSVLSEPLRTAFEMQRRLAGMPIRAHTGRNWFGEPFGTGFFANLADRISRGITTQSKPLAETVATRIGEDGPRTGRRHRENVVFGEAAFFEFIDL